MSELPLQNMPFTFASVDFGFEVTEPILFDKYPGFIIRSGFGAALKRLCLYDSKRVPCNQCYLKDTCPYAYIFETFRPGDKEIDFTAERFPHPFVFYPHLTRPGLLAPGSSFRLTITLFGNGIPYLLFYIYAFDLLGQMGLGRARGTFSLQYVTDSLTGRLLYQHSDRMLQSKPTTRSLQELIEGNSPQHAVTMTFLTPTKIEHRSRTIETLTPDILIRRLLRRSSLLAERHLAVHWDIDFRGIVDTFNADVRVEDSRLKVEQYKRYTARQRRSHCIYAFTGQAKLTGNLVPYMPLLRLGSFMQIGNSTSQGLGKYTLTEA